MREVPKYALGAFVSMFFASAAVCAMALGAAYALAGLGQRGEDDGGRPPPATTLLSFRTGGGEGEVDTRVSTSIRFTDFIAILRSFCYYLVAVRLSFGLESFD